MDIPIQGFLSYFTSGALHFKCPMGTGVGLCVPPWPPRCGEAFARVERLETPPAAWEVPALVEGWAAQQGNPKAPPNPATLLMQKTTPHRPIF